MSSLVASNVESRSSRIAPRAEACADRPRLLIVDQDDESAATLHALAVGCGYETAQASSAVAAIDACRSFMPDLAIVDLDMTAPSTLRLGLQFVDVEKLPFIVYSQATDVSYRVVALQLGADNYLPKPMDHRLLMAHLDATMRRVERNRKHGRLAAFEDFGPYQVNRINRNVRYRGNTVRLSGTEFELFWLLANRFGEIVDRRALIAALELNDAEVLGRAIDQRIFRLRHRLVAAGAPKDAIKSLRGKGFVLTGSVATALRH